MTAPIKRPDEWNTLGDHDRRIRILEANPGGEGGSLRACVGCFDVDPEFADCIDLDFNACAPLGTYAIGAGASPVPLTPFTPELVGPYLCNYSAGFRMQVRFQGDMSSGVGLPNVKLWGNIVHGTGPPGVSGWFEMYTSSSAGPVPVDTGWITATTDPTGIGVLGDDWYLWLGESNSSIIFVGQIGPGMFCWRYIDESTAAQMSPLPQEIGDLMVATGSPPRWTILPPGTGGQVLTMSGGLPTWV